MAKIKDQHYVPVTYLKSWTVNSELICLPLNSGFPRKQPPRSICKKNHLYTIPDSFYQKTQTATDINRYVVESIILKVWEDAWPRVLSNLESIQSDEELQKNLKGFVISQSLRSPKAIQNILSRSDALDDIRGKPRVPKEYYSALIGGVNMVTITRLLNHSVCEILKIESIQNFITSDNPASYWLLDEHGMTMLPALAIGLPTHEYSRMRIICPIHPKYLAVIKIREDFDLFEFKVRTASLDDVIYYNRIIETSADKLIIAKHMADLQGSLSRH